VDETVRVDESDVSAELLGYFIGYILPDSRIMSGNDQSISAVCFPFVHSSEVKGKERSVFI